MKSAAVKLSLLAFSLAFTLGSLEGVLWLGNYSNASTWRVRGIFQLDEELIYSLKPNTERVWQSDEFTEDVKINSFGLRDTELLPRSEFERRIVVLGDSMTFGHGVSSEQTYCEQVEQLFADQGRRVDVVNAGVKGYGTDQSVKFFTTRLRQLDADLVILAVYQNDISDNINLPLYTIEDHELIDIDPTKNWLYALGTIDQKLPPFVRQRKLCQFAMNSFTNRDLYGVLPDLDQKELIQWSKSKVILQIERLQELCHVDSFRVLIVCLPYRDGPTNQYNWIPEDSIQSINLIEDPVWRDQAATLFFKTDYHLTAKGHRLVAEQVFEKARALVE